MINASISIFALLAICFLQELSVTKCNAKV